jgi:hypothetical protein
VGLVSGPTWAKIAVAERKRKVRSFILSIGYHKGRRKLTKSTKPILSFKVCCSHGSRLYYEVRIYDTLAALRKVTGLKKCLGVCTYLYRDKLDPPASNKIGIIYLHKKHLGSEIVSHECAHAACGFLDRKGIKNLETGNPGSKHGEELAYAVGYMTSKIYAKLYKSKIIE